MTDISSARWRAARESIRVGLGPFTLTAAIALAGGSLFAALQLPLPWLLGAMAATMVGALFGLPVMVPQGMRKLMLMIAGSLIGTSFSPDALARVGDWPVTVAAMLPFVAVTSLASLAYFRIRSRFDPLTALLASIPGGLSVMIALADALGADERRVALAQSIRVLAIVFLIPLLVTVTAGPLAGSDAAGPASAQGLVATLENLAELGAVAGIGVVAGTLARLPAPYIVGPMIVGALAHLVGLSHAFVPEPLLFVSFLVIGASIGARFRGTSFGELATIGWSSFLAALWLLLIAVLASFGLASALGLPFMPVLLAFAPGGVYEMCLIAIAFGIDPAFVSFHHLVRLALVMVVTPILMPRIAAALPGSGRRG